MIEHAKVEFKEYPLVLGTETDKLDNPGSFQFSTFDKCPAVAPKEVSDKERDAINFTESQKIKVSTNRLQCYEPRGELLTRLVLHEYLGLIGIHETESDASKSYEISNALLAAFKNIQTFDDGLEIILIKTCKDFQNIGDRDLAAAGLNMPMRKWKLANDIDCSESSQWNNGKGFKPKVLNGSLDGDGHRVMHIYSKWQVPLGKLVDESGRDKPDAHSFPKFGLENINVSGAALFAGNCFHCSISNISFEDAKVWGSAILIYENIGTIENVGVDGQLHYEEFSTQDFEAPVGGISAVNVGIIAHSTFKVEITPDYDLPLDSNLTYPTGGITGINFQGGNIHHCNIDSKITGSSTEMGGLVGENYSGAISWVTGQVKILATANDQTIGGAVAINDISGKVEKCNLSVAVEFESFLYSSILVGGLIGYVDVNSTKGNVLNELSQKFADDVVIVSFCNKSSEAMHDPGTVVLGAQFGVCDTVHPGKEHVILGTKYSDFSLINLCGEPKK